MVTSASQDEVVKREDSMMQRQDAPFAMMPERPSSCFHHGTICRPVALLLHQMYQSLTKVDVWGSGNVTAFLRGVEK